MRYPYECTVCVALRHTPDDFSLSPVVSQRSSDDAMRQAIIYYDDSWLWWGCPLDAPYRHADAYADGCRSDYPEAL